MIHPPPVRLALVLACALPLALPAPAQAAKSGRVYVNNSTARDVTITCTAYLDSFGGRHNVLGGAWSVKAFGKGYLNDLGKPFYASRFEFTITSTEGTSSWYSTAFNAAGDLTVTVDADVFKRHLAALPARAAPKAPAVVARGPTKEAAQRAIVKILGAAVLDAAAKSEKKGPDTFGDALARTLALRARDELVESALKDAFPGRALRDIQAARRVICLELDGKLTVRNFNRAQAKEDLLGELKKVDPGAGSAAELADFIYDVMQARRRR